MHHTNAPSDSRTQAFLGHLHQCGQHAYYWTLPDRASRWWPAGQPGSLPPGKLDCYVGVHPTTCIPATNAKGELCHPEAVRAQLPFIAAINCLFAEFDAKDFSGDKAQALVAIEALDPVPSVLIDSGGGYHAYWLLDTPWVLTTDDDRQQAGRLQAAWVTFVEGDPQSKDLARVLRIPGTLNHKYDPPRPVTFMYCDLAKLYARDELAALAASFMATKAFAAGSTTTTNERYANAALVREIVDVTNAPDGLKRKVLLSAATSLGELVAGGALERAAVEQALYAAIAPRAADLRTAQQTIQDGLAYGAARPRRGPRKATNTNNPDIIRSAVCASLPLTDLGNAQRLVQQHGDDLRFVYELGWMAWTGTHWQRDTTGEVFRRAKLVARELLVEATRCPDEERARKIAAWAHVSESRARIEAMVSLAQSEPDIPAGVDQFDQQGWLLSCQNGTIDLRSGELLVHNRDHYSTKVLPTPYDPAATCPQWHVFLDRIFAGRQHIIDYLQVVAGYVLTGLTVEHVMWVFYGTGANGKTTFLEVLRGLLGEYARQADPATFLARVGSDRIPNDIARLTGARFVTAVEIEEGRRLAESVVKQMVSSDTLIARYLHKEFFEFRPTFKLFLAANYRPVIRGGDEGIWRRIKLVPFTVTIPPEERDKQLLEKLFTELPGILAWAVQGCLRWQRDGLRHPPEVEAATTQYRHDMDAIGLFLEECCVVVNHARVECKALYVAYSTWCEEANERTLSQRRFGQTIEERGFPRERGTHGTWYRAGLGLLDAHTLSANAVVTPRVTQGDVTRIRPLPHQNEPECVQVTQGDVTTASFLHNTLDSAIPEKTLESDHLTSPTALAGIDAPYQVVAPWLYTRINLSAPGMIQRLHERKHAQQAQKAVDERDD